MIGPFYRRALWRAYVGGVIAGANGGPPPTGHTEGPHGPVLMRAERLGYEDAQQGCALQEHEFEPLRYVVARDVGVSYFEPDQDHGA